MAASKYDGFWKKALDKHGSLEQILNGARKNERVELSVEGIQEFGNRQSWYGKTILSNKGKTGGDIMAHVSALKNLLPQYIQDDEEFVVQMNQKGTTLTITWLG